IDRDQKIVDQLDPARGTEFAEIETGIGKAGDDPLRLLAGLRIAGKIDDALLRRDHAGGSGDFAIDEFRALALQWRDLALLVRHRMRAELDDDLPGLCRL